MFEAYILPILIFTIIGLIAGALLTIAAKVFAVEVDPRIEQVNEALPQVNCGACGYSGCAGYAAAIVEEGAAPDLCKPGGEKSAKSIAEIMGVSVAESVPMTAVVRCSGDCESEKIDFNFTGIDTCEAAKRFYGGMWGCKYGCIGLGDCSAVCPTGAINVKDGLARVTPSKCIACELCAKACPNGIIDIRKSNAAVDVLCSSKDFGKNVKAVCKNGCIGCKMCVKQCEFDAIVVTDNIARIDYDKCTGCGKCAEKCPVHVIHMM